MKTYLPLTLLTILLTAAILSGCAAQPAAAVAAIPANAPAQTAPTAASDEPAAPQPTQTSAPVQKPTHDPAQEQEDLEEQAEQAARAYFTAASEGKHDEAASLISQFSLMVFEITRGDASAALNAQKIAGISWSNLEVLDTRPFDAQTMLVHVTYSETAPKTSKGSVTPAPEDSETPPAETIEALWPMRLENGQWLYNWNNLIDFRTIDTPAQTTSGVTMMPVQINRYSDRIQLIILVQNRTNDAVVFGQVNETLGIFHFGDQAVEAEKTQWILNPLRSVPGAVLEAKGFFADYPDMVEIRKWKNYDVLPWYTFQLQ